MATVIEVARSYWNAEESRSIPDILNHFLPNATWVGPGRTAVGHDELRAFYDESIAAYPGLRVRITAWYGSDRRAAIEWCAAFTGMDGSAHGLHGVNIMECREGKISFLATYHDPAELDTVLDSPHEAHSL